MYTLHDHIPHSKIFNDDLKGVEYLVAKSDSVIFLNNESRRTFKNFLPENKMFLIPEGSIRHTSSKESDEFRTQLGVPRDNILCILVGILEDYKGVDLILTRLNKLPDGISIRIAGTCSAEYARQLLKLRNSKRECGIDLDISFGYLSDEDFGNYLEAADYFIYPCRVINNSGSLNAALSHGLPVVVPRRINLDWIPESCKIYIEGDNPEEYEIQESLFELKNVQADKYALMRRKALEISETKT